MSDFDKIQRLEASLTADQWKILGSPGGLGLGDLTEKQQPIFEDLLPESPHFRQTMIKGGGPDEPLSYQEDIPDSDVILDDTQRQNVRLRLDRTMLMNLVDTKGEPFWLDAFQSVPSGTRTVTLVKPATVVEKKSTLFGQTIRSRVPNRLKPSDLDLKAAALDVWVPITGAKTVGDLIAAARVKTGLALYVDGRLARLPIVLSMGGSPFVHANSLLEALCWALCATYRKVGPTDAAATDVAYVLTYDREGLAARRERIEDWADLGRFETQQARGGFYNSIQAQKPRQFLTFAKGNLLAPTPEAEKAIQDARATADGNAPITYPLSVLTPEQKRQFQAGLREVEKMKAEHITEPTDARGDRVAMSYGLQMTFVIPGVGEMHPNFTMSDDFDGDAPIDRQQSKVLDEMAAAAKPIPGSRVILAVAAPQSAEEARALMALAAERGVKQVWIHLKSAADGKLAECVAAGKSAQMPVGAILDLMHAPAESLTPATENLNIDGETGTVASAAYSRELESHGLMALLGRLAVPNGDVLDPVAAGSLGVVTARAARATDTPDLALLALRDAAPPGYGLGEGANEERGFGYTVANRLAFLRLRGYDPIDIGDRRRTDWQAAEATRLPFFDTDGADDIGSETDHPRESPEFGTAQTAWHDLRREQQLTFLKSLRTTLGASAPALPIYLAASANEYAYGGDDYQLWDRTGPVPITPPADLVLLHNPTLRKSTLPQIVYHPADPNDVKAYDHGMIQRYGAAGELDIQLHYVLTPDPKEVKAPPPVVVVDLSSVPVSDALGLIRAAFVGSGG